MPGRIPKHADQRQRRNIDPLAATLVEDSPLADGEAPELPTRLDDDGKEIPWHEFSIRYWADIWSSPMRTEYTRADVWRLVMMLDAFDRYWSGSATYAQEVRLQGDKFGLTPIDRRKLGWTVRQAMPDAVTKPPQRRKDPPDPRLKAVK